MGKNILGVELIYPTDFVVTILSVIWEEKLKGVTLLSINLF